MTKLNEAGLSAAREALNRGNPGSRHISEGGDMDWAEAVVEAYFEQAEIDTKERLHPTDRSKHLEGYTTKFIVGGVEGYITLNDFHDGRLGEIFLHGVGKEGSTVTGLMDLVAILISVSLQYGVPLPQLTKFMKGMNFEPKDRDYSSIPDYIGHYLEGRYGS